MGTPDKSYNVNGIPELQRLHGYAVEQALRALAGIVSRAYANAKWTESRTEPTASVRPQSPEPRAEPYRQVDQVGWGQVVSYVPDRLSPQYIKSSMDETAKLLRQINGDPETGRPAGPSGADHAFKENVGHYGETADTATGAPEVEMMTSDAAPVPVAQASQSHMPALEQIRERIGNIYDRVGSE